MEGVNLQEDLSLISQRIREALELVRLPTHSIGYIPNPPFTPEVLRTLAEAISEPIRRNLDYAGVRQRAYVERVYWTNDAEGVFTTRDVQCPSTEDIEETFDGADCFSDF